MEGTSKGMVYAHCLHQKKKSRRENEGSQHRGQSWGSSGAPPSCLESTLVTLLIPSELRIIISQ